MDQTSNFKVWNQITLTLEDSVICIVADPFGYVEGTVKFLQKVGSTFSGCIPQTLFIIT